MTGSATKQSISPREERMDCFVASAPRNEGKQKTPPNGGVLHFWAGTGGAKPSVLFEKAGKLLLDPQPAAAAIEHLLGAAGPGRVRLGVDVEVQLVAFLAPGGAGLVLGTVGHHDRNVMIIRVNFGFHDLSFGAPAPVAKCLGLRIWAGL